MINLFIIAIVLYIAELIMQCVAGKIAVDASNKGRDQFKLASVYFLWFFILQLFFIAFLHFIGLL